MEFENQMFEWQNEGTEPSTELKTTGFQAGYKPPAAVFNHFWSKTTKAITELQEKISTAGTRIVTATSTDGVAYTATLDGITELYTGLEITIIPDKTSTNVQVTLDINGLGGKPIRLPLGSNTGSMGFPDVVGFFVAGRPVKVIYDTGYSSTGTWRITDRQKNSAQDLNGIVAVENGGTGASTAEQARANLGAAETATYAATITTNNWMSGSGGSSNSAHTQNITGDGSLESDNPIIDITLTGTKAANLQILEEWGKISRIETKLNKIVVTCYEDKPTVNIPIQIKVVR